MCGFERLGIPGNRFPQQACHGAVGKIRPYARTTHIYVAFPKRFVPWRSPQHYDYLSATERPGLSEGSS